MAQTDFRKKLIDYRKARGMTQEELAEKSGISIRTIQRIETGEVIPRAYTIKVLSDYLGIGYFDSNITGDNTVEGETVSESGVSTLKKSEVDFDNAIVEKHTAMWYLKDLFNLKTKTMKKVSILLTTLLLAGFGLFALNSDIMAQEKAINSNCMKIEYNKDKTVKKVEVSYTNNLTLDSLYNIKTTLDKIGITVNYRSLTFDNNNRLKAIECHIDCNDGYKGSFYAPSLDKYIEGKNMGFFRDYDKNAGVAFCTGRCN
jgi:transcriptional regulator with XRE-family HTH domain